MTKEEYKEGIVEYNTSFSANKTLYQVKERFKELPHNDLPAIIYELRYTIECKEIFIGDNGKRIIKSDEIAKINKSIHSSGDSKSLKYVRDKLNAVCKLDRIDKFVEEMKKKNESFNK